MGIPVKIIKLVRMTMDNIRAKVKVGNKFSESFQFNAGVKHGCGLSTTLLHFALHSVINKADQKGTLLLKSSPIYAYADDLVVVTRDVITLKQMYLAFEREIRSTGLTVHEKEKKKNFMISTSQARRSPENLSMGEKKVEDSLVLLIWELG